MQFVSVPLVGVPRIGVTKVGEVAKTKAPEPVSFVTALARFALVGVARKAATPLPSPEMPVSTGRPVQFVRIPDVGVPSNGVTKVGDVANTRAPDPVSSVTAEARFALEGVARNVATPVPRPLIPVLTGRPVQFVRVPLVGVPSRGVTNVGEVAKTSAPEPVSSVTAAAKFALDGVARNVATPVPRPVTPLEMETVMVMLAEPSNETPFMVRAVSSAVAVEALPVRFPMAPPWNTPSMSKYDSVELAAFRKSRKVPVGDVSVNRFKMRVLSLFAKAVMLAPTKAIRPEPFADIFESATKLRPPVLIVLAAILPVDARAGNVFAPTANTEKASVPVPTMIVLAAMVRAANAVRVASRGW